MAEVPATAAHPAQPVQPTPAVQPVSPARPFDLVSPAPPPDWGRVDVWPGSRSPWGQVQYAEQLADGVVSVGCAGHGGVKLSRERNAAIPPALRERSGWYEEDCAAEIAAMYHPEAFTPKNNPLTSVGRTRQQAENAVKDWFPDKYEKATGRTLQHGESTTRDHAEYERIHDGELALYAIGAREDPDHPGYVRVNTKIIGDRSGTFGKYLVPLDVYEAADQQRKYGRASVSPVLDRSKIIDVTPPPPPPKPVRERHRGFDLGPLTASQRERARTELGKRYRDRQGRILTLQEKLESGGFSGKTVIADVAGKNVYYLEAPTENEGEPAGDTRLWEVSAATWKAYSGPDTRSEKTRVNQDIQHAYRRLNSATTRAQRDRANADLERLSARRDQLSAAKAES